MKRSGMHAAKESRVRNESPRGVWCIPLRFMHPTNLDKQEAVGVRPLNLWKPWRTRKRPHLRSIVEGDLQRQLGERVPPSCAQSFSRYSPGPVWAVGRFKVTSSEKQLGQPHSRKNIVSSRGKVPCGCTFTVVWPTRRWSSWCLHEIPWPFRSFAPHVKTSGNTPRTGSSRSRNSPENSRRCHAAAAACERR
jgi:hypothetical protein